jgi:hypothetical protein
MWRLVILILLLAGGAQVGTADEVHLKDGQRLQSTRAWVVGDYAHFILEGTADVEIRYALEIVDRVVSTDGKLIYPEFQDASQKGTQDSPTAPVAAGTVPKQSAPVQGQIESQPTRSKAPAPKTGQVVPEIELQIPAGLDTKLLRAKAKKLRETPFYDPRRTKKYWAYSQSRHDDAMGAVEALAEFFGRSSQWVTQYMGNTNDLGQIHLNLIRRLEQTHQPLPTDTRDARKTATANTGKTAPPPPAPPSKKPIQKAKTPAKPAKVKNTVRSSNPFASNLPDTEGPLFYNPRRPKKFWANESSRHNALDDALDALSDQYNRPVSWIESHMGASNSLQVIHRNLTEAIQKETK